MKKVLLDESLPRKLKNFLKDVCDPKTVTEMRWNAKTNGDLLSFAKDAGFEILIIVDKNLVHQQNLSKYGIQVVLLDSFKNTLEVLEPFILKFKSLLIENKLTEIYTIIKI
jgi:hypothetical protein